MSGLSESLEDYLEVILDLELTQKVARAKDIASKMKVQRGSVTSALKNLEEKGLINYEPYSFITLTPKGKKIAREITYCHNVLKNFLVSILQVDETTADATACKMEHAIDKKSLERLTQFFDFIHNCPRTGEDWIQSFLDFCAQGKKDINRCRKCIEDCNTRLGTDTK